MFFLISVVHLSTATTIYKNSKAGYTVELPDDWYVLTESDSQDVFYNLNTGSQSYISVFHHQISQNLTGIDWTRYHYMAYLIVAEEWEDPWGSIVAIDSSQSCMVDSTWAPQAYVQFVSLDSNGNYIDWVDHTTFTAKNGIGYELTVTSDTLDFTTNGATYLQILQSINFITPSSVLKPFVRKSKPIKADYRVFDILGRSVPSLKLQNKNAMILVRNRSHFINNMK